MDRTAGQFCSRESMYRPQNEANMPKLRPLVDVREEVINAAMTWQQRKDFGPTVKANERKSKSVHWQPLDLTTVEDPPVTSTIGNGESWSEQRAKVAIVNPRRHPREKAATPSPISSPPAPIAPPSLPDTPHDEQKLQKKQHKRPYRRNKKSKDMAPLPKSAYVPPHLRGRVAVPTGINGEKATIPATTVRKGKKATTSATKTSSAESVNPKQKSTSKLHSSPNGVSHASTLTASLSTTPQEVTPIKVEARQVDAPHVAEKTAAPQEAEKTVQPHEDDNVSGNAWPGWDAPKPEPPATAPKTGNPRWPRIRGPPPRKTVWPKQRDMKPISDSDSDSEGGVSYKSNSNGDPSYDVKKLMDWNGDWLPPPEQWSARKGHTSRHLGQDIEKWINGHGNDCLNAMDLATSAFTDAGKEVVPKYWIVSQIEQGSLGEFWKLMPTRQPTALSDVSLHAPFWERYETSPASCFIEGLAVPDARVDPNDPENHFGGADLLVSGTERIQRIMEQRQNAHRRTLAKQRRPILDTVLVGPQPKDKRIQPKSNVYFRPVQPIDVEGIAKIYNHYVDHTIFANEFDARTEDQIRDRINVIVTAGLPYLVAVARGNQPRGPAGFVTEKIVGFASLDDYCDQSSMYRYTFEMELYTHPGYQSQNIASCLLDRLLEMANTGYNACGGYEYRNDWEYLKTGPSRVIKTIMLTVCKENGENDDQTAEFMKRFKFYRAGHIPRMGYKLDKVVDVFLYRHTTSETIEPGSRPSVPLER